MDDLTERLENGEIHIVRALERCARAELPNDAAIPRLWLERWLRKKKEYDPRNDARYPFRDVDGNTVPARIDLPRKSLKSQSGRAYDAKLVEPFISKADTGDGDAVRAGLHAALSCRRFEERDKKHENETALVGQRMVVANTRIRKGACLGVYGGTIIPPELFSYIVDRTHTLVVPILMSAPRAVLSAANAFDGVKNACLCIDGDAIISRMNTIFAYDANGLPCKQAAGGYSVDVAWFKAKLGANDVSLPAFFALRDIVPGEELRWNYEYSLEAIADHVIVDA